ncbi:TPA: DUF1311 domain-containing protein [Aeromonas salmonicida]|nr:lysozyme inhibitor LprI family protein [Aeromonas salmonicida]MUG31100.1 DUF1311 domain-containing protein [Aeromonas salmonicida]HEA3091745.1 DUF1311 domain-containing protein [Aeromonas salmonicida]
MYYSSLQHQRQQTCPHQPFCDRFLPCYKTFKLVATLDKEQLGRLKTAQRAWITFRDAQCRYEAAVYDSGSIAPLVHSSCLTNLTELCTKDLIAQQDQQ